MIKKNDILSTQALLQYINNYTKNNVKTLYHYTTYESLLMILRNKSFRLSRHDLMNDKAEESLARCSTNEKRYVISFSNNEKEYVSMWAMYGKSSGIKIRVDFPTVTFKDCINGKFYFDSNKTERIETMRIIPNQYNYKKDFFLHDMVYFDKNERTIKHNARPFQQLTVTENAIDDLAGFIKYDAWEFEKETRLSVLLELEECTIDAVKHIYAGITPDLIKEMSITYNPWITETLMGELQKSIDAMAGYKLVHKTSTNHGEIAEL